MRILVIEDEEELAGDMIAYLHQEQHRCEWAADHRDAMEKVREHRYDCILLDQMLPGGDGLTILRELKTLGRTDGVIIISAKDAIGDKVDGLTLGADDYLAKPFHLVELGARINSVIRRNQFHSHNTITEGALTIDLLAKTVRVNDVPVHLTRKEYELLLFLIGNKGRVLSKSALAEHLSGDLADMFDNHDFVYAHVKNLKRKLGDQGFDGHIRTLYGTGYRWEP